MSKLFSEDKSMFATFGKTKNGTYSATVHMAAQGDDYPAFGVDKSEGFESRADAQAWAAQYMVLDEDDDVLLAHPVSDLGLNIVTKHSEVA